MDVVQLTTADIELLAEVFMIWSGIGIFLGLLAYDFVCWILQSTFRRFSSTPES